ncbi:GyrI-like domain-containing protein [Lachnospiraceae bacterium 54-53]
MDMRIETIPPYRIAYMRRTGAYGAGNSQLMETFKGWMEENHLWEEQTVILGIAQDNPELVKPEECRYDVCLVITDNSSIRGDGVKFKDMDGGKYAVFKIRHTSEAVQKAWDGIFPELARQELAIDECRPVLERYRMELLNNQYCEICVPIK